MTNDDNEEVIWSSEMTDRRRNDRRTIDQRRRMSGEKNILKVPNLRRGEERRSSQDKDRRRKIKLTITGRAVEVGKAPKNN